VRKFAPTLPAEMHFQSDPELPWPRAALAQSCPGPELQRASQFTEAAFRAAAPCRAAVPKTFGSQSSDKQLGPQSGASGGKRNGCISGRKCERPCGDATFASASFDSNRTIRREWLILAESQCDQRVADAWKSGCCEDRPSGRAGAEAVFRNRPIGDPSRATLSHDC